MSMNKNQLITEIIRPTLKAIEKWSPAAENLLLGTCAQETNMGTYLRQLERGPGMGIYSMERATHKDIWNNYLKYKAADFTPLLVYCGYAEKPGYKALLYNLRYATAMARIHYWRVKAPLPEYDNISGLAKYWKKYYNTPLGKGTEQEFIDNYKRFIM